MQIETRVDTTLGYGAQNVKKSYRIQNVIQHFQSLETVIDARIKGSNASTLESADTSRKSVHATLRHTMCKKIV